MDKENRNEPFNHRIPITMKQKLTHSYTLQNGARRQIGIGEQIKVTRTETRKK